MSHPNVASIKLADLQPEILRASMQAEAAGRVVSQGLRAGDEGQWINVADPRAEVHISSGYRHKEVIMTEEKKKPEEDDVSEEQLQDVSGGGVIMEDKRIIDIGDGKVSKATEPLDKKLTEPLDKNILER